MQRRGRRNVGHGRSDARAQGPQATTDRPAAEPDRAAAMAGRNQSDAGAQGSGNSLIVQRTRATGPWRQAPLVRKLQVTPETRSTRTTGMDFGHSDNDRPWTEKI